MSYTWRTDDKNKNGLTWPEWFKKNYGDSYAVTAGWSPVLTAHEKYFDLWRSENEYSLG